jgi:hypothetical protein
LDSLLQRLPPRFAKAHGIVKLVNERKQSINACTLWINRYGFLKKLLGANISISGEFDKIGYFLD